MSKTKKCAGAVLAFVAVCSLLALSPLLRRAKLIFTLAPTAQTINSAPIEIGSFSLAEFDNSVSNFVARVSAIELATGKAKSFEAKGSFKRHNGVTETVGARVQIPFETGDPVTGAWDFEISFDDVLDRMVVTVTGTDNAVIDWRAVISIHLYQP